MLLINIEIVNNKLIRWFLLCVTKKFTGKIEELGKLKNLGLLCVVVIVVGCAPPLKDECFSSLMDQWESAVITEKDGENFRFISVENADGVLDAQYYPDTREGKTLFESYSWSKCTNK